ncbi:hypothetical protein Y032_0560g3458 [Ancylostoma ceylanicum]|uniref:Integrase catalytic domain-containing protein n=1 Tax=Ancylostoma ceylanicum TaxID=53326 RepID=A0A016WPB7_9BILA|nr:hypothetical protein Y032_0560g3458 [Ancylostoma ceylanicum]
MPHLPAARVNRSRPFRKIGLDYLGSIKALDDMNSVPKVWVCLFTCMATRAVHPENLGNNSTNEFLLAFCRFAARRGVPDTVISDNSTLVAANDFLQMTLLEISGSDLANDYLSKQIVSSESLGILFTCMATRAVHPENLGNNSTKEFLLAFCRFAARRGVPDTVISDNSTLVAANDFLQMTLLEISGNDLVNDYLSKQIVS